MTRRRLRLPAAIALLAIDSAREASHQLNADMQQVGHSLHRWWDQVRTRVAEA
jgi:hypothetical protein